MSVGRRGLLAVLLLCAAAAEAGPAKRNRLVRAEAQLGAASAVIRPDGAVAGRGRAAAAVSEADDPEDAEDAELTEEADDPEDAEDAEFAEDMEAEEMLMQDSGAEEMPMKDGAVGLSRSAAGGAKVCAKKPGDNCTCKGIMVYASISSPIPIGIAIRVDGEETCSSNPAFRRRRNPPSEYALAYLKNYQCLCFDMDACTDIATANNRTIDAAHRRRRFSWDITGRRRGTGLAQRRRWCGLAPPPPPPVPACEFSDWGSWSECQTARNSSYGVQLRSRSVKETSAPGCTGDLEEMSTKCPET